MLDTNPADKWLIRPTHCCDTHHLAGTWFACCDPETCIPCCPDCPTCPGFVLERGFRQEWDWIERLAAASIAAVVRSMP